MSYLVYGRKILIVPPLHAEKEHWWPVDCNLEVRLQWLLSSPQRHLFYYCCLAVDKVLLCTYSHVSFSETL